MQRNRQDSLWTAAKWSVLATGLVLATFLPAGIAQAALTVNVVNSDGASIATGYRWTIEEDKTFHVAPGVLDPNPQSLNFAPSYMPVVATGYSNGAFPALDPSKHYFISILPDSGFAMGGAAIKPGQEDVKIIVTSYPLPTAQMSIFVFEDNQPINGSPDLPEEEDGLEGFQIKIDEAAGHLTQDAFGNPLGTTYDSLGNIVDLGSNDIRTDANGRAQIQNLAPGKYGVQIIPPAGQGWTQTSTIEGKKTIDAWLKPGEPRFFVEFGLPGEHVFVGFVKAMDQITDPLSPSAGEFITGRIVNLHPSRPPNFTHFGGEPNGHSPCWVGLNDLAVGEGNGVYAQPCDDEGGFAIPKPPAGNYQIVIWDQFLDTILALNRLPQFGGFVVGGPGEGCGTASGTCDLGDVPVFNWFGRMVTNVFFDHNENGFRDCVNPDCDDPSVDDVGMQEQAVLLRFPDGSGYQEFPTDVLGFLPFDQVFPFFSWLVIEVDFGRFKATGATFVADAGGPILPHDGWNYPSFNELTPQPQFEADGVTPIINPNTGNNLSRTETGPVLTQGFQTFAGSTQFIDFGKSLYGPTENGGISGIIYYATTRAEDPPAFGAGEPWEPGVPRVPVALYQDNLNNATLLPGPDGIVDDLNNSGQIEYADVDHFPFENFPGGEDVDHNGNGAFDLGDADRVSATDSWDDNLPTDCQGPDFVHRGTTTDCYDGLRNYNQMRPALFDGGYAFCPGVTGDPDEPACPPGTYIVEAIAPPGYVLMKEEDRNVDFGDEYVSNSPVPALLPAVCVGDVRTVPPIFSFLTDGAGNALPGVDAGDPDNAAPFAGASLPLCDRKQVQLNAQANAAADFFLFTPVPVAGHVVGFILDDLSNEFDVTSPNFGEKFAPPWLPIAIRDWKGQEIQRLYSDEFGRYNTLVPSTYSVNLPQPSGVAPNMLQLCMNDPGPLPDGSIDPFYNRKYSQFCYTLNFMPGTTTYLDTPVVPIAAFAGKDQFVLDCELADGTPRIYSAIGTALGGGSGYVPSGGNNGLMTIVSMGDTLVLNPGYDGAGGVEPKNIIRDYGFGNDKGFVSIGGKEVDIDSWSSGIIVIKVKDDNSTGQLEITRRDNGVSTISGLTVDVGSDGGFVHYVTPDPTGDLRAEPIQDAIDLASDGDLILLAPGTYSELPVLYKSLRLKGAGLSTTISGARIPVEKIQDYREKVEALWRAGKFDFTPEQFNVAAATLFADPDNLEPEPFGGMGFEGPAITVLGGDGLPSTLLSNPFGNPVVNEDSLIDGITITGANDGGIIVNAYTKNLQISNNRITSNQADFAGGGIRVGNDNHIAESRFGAIAQDNFNDDVSIHHNHITENGTQEETRAGGGGIAMCSGADGYEITRNYICGNFSMGGGGGVSHYGFNPDGVIANNRILFNQSFNQEEPVSGGGIYITGVGPLNNPRHEGLSQGTGDVTVFGNLIQGNQAGAGDGAGIRVLFANGLELLVTGADQYKVDIENNIIVNNVAGNAGAISLQDATNVRIRHNTIANNDSTATAGLAFGPGSPNISTPQVAGIISRAHSPAMQAALAGPDFQEFPDPELENNIIWHNRSFHVDVDTAVIPAALVLVPDPNTPTYADLGVEGTLLPAQLDPENSVLTDATGFSGTNVTGDPLFVSGYLNGNGAAIIQPELKTGISLAPAFDEGGNYIDARFGPLSPWQLGTSTLIGDYHITAGSAALSIGDPGALPGGGGGGCNLALDPISLNCDFDGGDRPKGGDFPDAGADEFNSVVNLAAPIATAPVEEEPVRTRTSTRTR